MNALLVTKEMTTTSLIIAEHFGKSHKNVLSVIDNLGVDEQLSRSFFRPSEYTNTRGKKYRCYEISELGSLAQSWFSALRSSLSYRAEQLIQRFQSFRLIGFQAIERHRAAYPSWCRCGACEI